MGPKSIDYIGNLVGRSQVAVDVHLRVFAADAGAPDLRYEQLRTVYEEPRYFSGTTKMAQNMPSGGTSRGPRSRVLSKS